MLASGDSESIEVASGVEHFDLSKAETQRDARVIVFFLDFSEE